MLQIQFLDDKNGFLKSDLYFYTFFFHLKFFEYNQSSVESYAGARPIKNCNNTEQKKNGIFSNTSTKKKVTIVYKYAAGLILKN
jgi:hypothetical protein